MSYSYDSIWINGRDVSIQSIVKNTAQSLNDFEKHTFSFIHDWLSGKEFFEAETSGSTGQPKKIILSRDQMIASALLTKQAIDLKAGDSALICLSPHHIAGKMMLVRCLVIGMQMIAVNPTANVFETIPQSMLVDFVAMVPYQIYNLVRSAESKRLNELKSILIGGAAIDDETSNMLNYFSCRCYATYGMTETISHIALQPLNGPSKSDEFRLLPGITVALDERGCIVINVPYLPEKVVTNDLGLMVTSLSFKWLGRWDNVINSGGVKIIPEVLEKKLSLALKDVSIPRNFILSSIPDTRLGEKLILLLEGKPLTPDEVNTVRVSTLKTLDQYEIPKEVAVLPQFVRSENGKLKRKETAQNYDKSLQNFTLKV